MKPPRLSRQWFSNQSTAGTQHHGAGGVAAGVGHWASVRRSATLREQRCEIRTCSNKASPQTKQVNSNAQQSCTSTPAGRKRVYRIPPGSPTATRLGSSPALRGSRGYFKTLLDILTPLCLSVAACSHSKPILSAVASLRLKSALNPVTARSLKHPRRLRQQFTGVRQKWF